MGRKLEDKILKKLKRRVLEKDQDLQNKQEQFDIIDSTKEALVELTSLSRKEIDQLEREIREEELTQQRKKRKVVLNIAKVVGVIVLGVGVFIYIQQNKIHLIETFDNNDRAWPVFEEVAHERRLENNSYLLNTHTPNWCFFDYIKVDFPTSYTVELASTWKRGKYEDHGLILLANPELYRSFNLYSDGYTKTSVYYGDRYVVNTKKEIAAIERGNGKNQNIQRVSVRGDNFRYEVNGKLSLTGEFNYLEDIKYVGLRVCDVQVVAFDYIKVTNDQTGEVIFFDDFKNEKFVKNDALKTGWSTESSIKKKGTIAGGQYRFTTNVGSECYWTTIPVPLANSEVEIVLSSTWQSGKTDPYGLVLVENSDNYYSFQVTNNGEAWLASSKDEADPITVSSSYFSDSVTAITQKVMIKDNTINYYVNDKLIGSQKVDLTIEQVGLQVCGKQTVAFDKLEIIEK
ncbi:MAG: hypothetical protein ACFB0B_18470 [Thermonemataceae bacterium]